MTELLPTEPGIRVEIGGDGSVTFTDPDGTAYAPVEFDPAIEAIAERIAGPVAERVIARLSTFRPAADHA